MPSQRKAHYYTNLHGTNWQVLALCSRLLCVGLRCNRLISIGLSVLLTICVLGGYSIQAQTAYSTSSTKTESPPVDDTDSENQDLIEQLILKLGSPSYAVRQSAVEQLWKLGKQAKPALERAATLGDPEVARRASQILSVWAFGVDTDTSPEIARLVLRFHSSEQNIRRGVLTLLLEEGKIRLAFDLLSQVESADDQQDLFHEVMDFNDRLIRLARSGQWEDFEYILSHPITFEHERASSVHFHMVMGNLEPMVARMKAKISATEQDSETPDTQDLLPLIAILRMQGNSSQAEIYIEKIEDVDKRTFMQNQLLMEQGDWQAIAKKMARPEDNFRPEEGKIVVTPAQRALVNHFIGNQSGYDDTVNELSEQLAEHIKNGDQPSADNIRRSLLDIGLANLDWPLVEAHLDREDKRQTFGVYAENNRFAAAFNAIEFGETLERRNLWYKRRIRNIKTLEDKIERLGKQGQDTDEVENEIREKRELCIEIARLLGRLGFTDESALHFQTVFASLHDSKNRYRRFEILGGLVQLERFDAAWRLIEHGIDLQDYDRLPDFIFPHHRMSAKFWFGSLAERYPDRLERLKIVSGIVNSPLGTTDEFDLNVELATALDDPLANLRGKIDYHFAKVFGFHGDEEASQRHMKMARELGWRSAKRFLALDSLEQGDHKSAIEFYDKAWLTRSRCFESALAAEAYRQSGDLKDSRLRKCLAYTFWRDSYSNTGTVQSFMEIDKTELIEDFIKLSIYGVQGTAAAGSRHRGELALAQRAKNPAASAISFQMNLFRAAGGPSGSQLLGYWSEARKQIKMTKAEAYINEGKFDEAVDQLLQYDDFCPGDPELGEKLILKLDQAGASTQADRLFEKLSDQYLVILEQYPDSSSQHNNYAWLCACAKRRATHMLRHIQIACTQRPNTPSYLDTLALVYFLQGDTEKAIEFCRRSLEINPSKRNYRQQLRSFLDHQAKENGG